MMDQTQKSIAQPESKDVVEEFLQSMEELTPIVILFLFTNIAQISVKKMRKHPKKNYACTNFFACQTFFDFCFQIPDEVIEYYLKKTGFNCPDIRMFVYLSFF
jgi:hypothetical protein